MQLPKGSGKKNSRPGQAGFFFFFLIGSQWGIQDFDKGGARLKKMLAGFRGRGGGVGR